MEVKDGILVLEDEVSDEMLDEFISLAKSADSISVETDNIGSLVVQQLFCMKDSKNIACNNSFIAKFFDDVRFEE